MYHTSVDVCCTNIWSLFASVQDEDCKKDMGKIVWERFRDEIRPVTPIYSLVPMYGSDLARVQAKSTEGSDFTLFPWEYTLFDAMKALNT